MALDDFPLGYIFPRITYRIRVPVALTSCSYEVCYLFISRPYCRHTKLEAHSRCCRPHDTVYGTKREISFSFVHVVY